jgi:hypothetical protein
MLSRSTYQRLFFITIIVLILMSACSQEKDGIPENRGEDTKQSASLLTSTRAVQTTGPLVEPAVSTPTINPPALETSPVNTPVPTTHKNTRYELAAELDYDNHQLFVVQQIHFTNNTTEPIPDLLLMVEPDYYPNVFQLNSINWASGEPIQGIQLENAQLKIPLSEPINPGEEISLSLTYELNIPSPEISPNLRPIPFGYTQRQTNLVDWYPFIPPYIPGQGWLAHEAGYYGEHLAYEISDFQVELKLAGGRDDLVIAASAADEGDGDIHRYNHENGRGFAFSVSHMYSVFTQTVGDITIYSYAFPHHATAGQSVLKTTAEAVELYSEIYGPYPRNILSAVEADFLDGMEYDGLYFLSNAFYNLSKNIPGEYLTAIAAHETAHQWFYAMVGNDQALEPWLDEALCTYSERLFYERYYPGALEWWWNYRIHFYQPGGWVNDSIYNPHGVSNAYRAYRDAVYLNGAIFLEDLRSLIGDESFFAFMADYVEKFTRKIATSEDFFTLLAAHTNADIQGLVDKYFLIEGG